MKPCVYVLITLLVSAGCGDRSTRTDRPYSSRGGDVTTTTTRDGAGRAVDDTGRNERDRNDATLTPGDQGNDESDLRRTAEIRKLIVGSSLSSDAKNVKVITKNGRVTLRGPVKTQAEKDEIVQLARQVAGADVDDQIEVESAR
jgi:hyperosmotically inducible periplasmic protein